MKKRHFIIVLLFVFGVIISNSIYINKINRNEGTVGNLALDKNAYYCNTVKDMVAKEELNEGDCVVTLGYYDVNDGGGATYKIKNTKEVEDLGGIIELNNGLKAELIINNNTIFASQYGAIKNNENNAIQLNRAIDKAVKNKYKIILDSLIEVKDEIKINGYINMSGVDENCGIKSVGKNENIITIEYDEDTANDYRFSNMVLENFSIIGNTDSKKQNAISMNSVKVIYSQILNISYKEIKGSALNLVNDKNSANQAFYSHNINWSHWFLYNTSQVITQENKNYKSDEVPRVWVYGGTIEDIHVEVSSGEIQQDYYMNLSGFVNINLNNTIWEGKINSDVKAFIYADNDLNINTIYFEPVLKKGVNIENYIEFNGINLKINNAMNLEKVYLPSSKSTCIIDGMNPRANMFNILRENSLGRIEVYNSTFGSYHTGNIEDDVIPNPFNNRLVLKKGVIGKDYMYNFDNSSLYYDISIDELMNKSINNPLFTVEFTEGQKLEKVNDPVYGECLKVIPSDVSNNKSLIAVKANIDKSYAPRITVGMTYKVEADKLGKNTNTIAGGGQSIPFDKYYINSGEWNKTMSMYENDGNPMYIRFDYNDGKKYSEPNVLYIKTIRIWIGTSFGVF